MTLALQCVPTPCIKGVGIGCLLDVTRRITRHQSARAREHAGGLESQAREGTGVGGRAGVHASVRAHTWCGGCFHCPGLKRQPRLFEWKSLLVLNCCNILKRCDSKLDVFILQGSLRMTGEEERALSEGFGIRSGSPRAPSVLCSSSCCVLPGWGE